MSTESSSSSSTATEVVYQDERSSPRTINIFDTLKEDEKVVAKNFNTVLTNCIDAVNVEKKIQNILKESIFKDDLSTVTPHLFTIENALLTLSSYPDCTEGIIYMLPLLFEVNSLNYLYIRCFESGIYKGFAKSLKKDFYQSLYPATLIEDVLLVSSFNEWDINAACSYRLLGRKGKSIVKNSTTFNMITRKNINSLLEILPISYAVLQKAFGANSAGYMVYCSRNPAKCKSSKVESKRFFKIEGLGDVSELEKLIQEFPVTNVSISFDSSLKFMSNIGFSNLSIAQQYEVISSIPNFHKWCAKKNHGVKRFEYFIGEGKSPRNQTLHSLLQLMELDEVDEDEITDMSNHRLKLITFILKQHYLFPDISFIQKSTAKKRKIRKENQRVKFSLQDLLRVMDISEEAFEHRKKETEFSLQSTLFEDFRDKIVNHGVIAWRVLTESEQTVVMNDYNGESGVFKFNNFVVASRKIEHGNNQVLWDCTCDTFKCLVSTVQLTSGNTEWEGIKCLHCRLLDFFIIKHNLQHAAVTSDHNFYETHHTNNDIITKAVHHSNTPVLPLPSCKETVKKFSVVSHHNVQFVNLFQSDVNDQWYISCSSGICQYETGKKRKIQNLNNASNICQHLKILRQFMDENEDLFQFLKVSENVCNDEDNYIHFEMNDHYVDEDEQNEIVESDIPNVNEISQNPIFDEESGEWKFPSPYGRDVVSSENDDQLRNCVLERDQIALEYLQQSMVHDFKPHIDSNVCSCGIEWSIDENNAVEMERDGTSILYTLTCAIPINVFKVTCTTGSCIVYWDGANDRIFRISKQICVGEELCWEFVNMVLKAKMSFSSYCDIMTSRYQLRNETQVFMSSKTFLKLFFSWSSHQRREFRIGCDWCGFEPKILACDGTKIGVAGKNVSVIPIEEFQEDEIIDTKHRRNERCFLSYKVGEDSKSSIDKIKKCRAALKNMMQSVDGFKKLIASPTPAFITAKKDLLETLPSEASVILQRMFEANVDDAQLTASVKLFFLLSFDSPLRSLIIYETLHFLEINLTLLQLDVDFDSKEFLDKCMKLSPYIGSFLKSFHKNNEIEIAAILFVESLVSKCKRVHGNDIPVSVEADEAVVPYNPPLTGRAYYFNSKGEQVRKVRKFTIDDKPTTSEISCSKFYPAVNRKGSSFMFLWFCPLHGHCYGFHVISGSEGRKDAANSLIGYLKKAPECIYYDFSCGLEEYCLNRESDFFKNTRFYHDIFHGYNHTCSPIYSSQIMKDLRGVNSSICEQFNSFLQCIKQSSKHMSQRHFMFFAQFMIDIWNRRKSESFKKRLNIAAAGEM